MRYYNELHNNLIKVILHLVYKCGVLHYYELWYDYEFQWEGFVFKVWIMDSML